MLNKVDIEFCKKVRFEGKFIKRYDLVETNMLVDDGDSLEIKDRMLSSAESIMVYEYEEQIYYLVMENGKYLDYFVGGN